MKSAIFNFLVLQVIIWSIVFSNSSEESDVQHASVSKLANTTEVVHTDQLIDSESVLTQEMSYYDKLKLLYEHF